MSQCSIGTKIRFKKTLIKRASGDSPECVYAFKGEMGEITGHDTPEGYWAKADAWPHSFGADEDEFEVVALSVRSLEFASNEKIRRLFHEIWTSHAGSPGYDKFKWTELRQLLNERDIDV